MRKAVVNDCWGGRWTVRACCDRYVYRESEYTRRVRESTLRAHLGPALAPQPGASPALPWAEKGTGRIRQTYERAGRVGALASSGGPVGAVLAIWLGGRALREPTDRFWIVELVARGRFRRGATWRVADRTDAEQVTADVADAIRAGQIPEPDGAQLIDVVDERLTVYGAPR